MKVSFRGLFLGWWLLGQWWMSRGESYPKPSISVHPRGMVALGGNVSIHCRTESIGNAEFYFHKEVMSSQTTPAVKDAKPYEVIFPIVNAKKSDGGKYWCIYHSKSDSSNWSSYSDSVYINLTDRTLLKPSIKVTPTGESAPVLNVTIQCQGPEKGLTFALHKESMQVAFQTTKPDRDTAEFPFVLLSSEDTRSYTCQYHHKNDPFVWSEPSEPVELVLGESSAVILPASIAAGLLLLVLLLLLLVCVLQRKKRKGSIAKEESRPMGKALEPDAGEELNEVSYAVLNHQSRKTKQASNLLDRSHETCLYASVAKN